MPKRNIVRVTANLPPLVAQKLALLARANYRQPGTEARVAIERHVAGAGRKVVRR